MFNEIRREENYLEEIL